MAKTKIDQIVLMNYKKHEKYSQKIDGNHFMVVGANGAGKTSILDTVKRLLGQKVKQPDVPVRQGADTATTGIFLSSNGDKYVVEEKFSANGRGRLRFYKVNGSQRDELQPALERLKEAIGTPVDFTPLIDKSGEDQFDYLKKNLGIDVSMHEAKYNNTYEDRSLLNKEVKNIAARITQIYVSDAEREQYKELKDAKVLMEQKVVLTPLTNELNQAELRNQAVDSAERTIADIEAEMLRLQKRLEDTKAWISSNPRIDKEVIQKKIQDAIELNQKLDQEIQTVSDHNRMVDKVNQFVAAEAELEQKKKESAEKTKQLKVIEGELFQAISQLPLKEIDPALELRYSVNDETGKVKEAGLFYEGLPLHRTQHSYGKLLKVIIRMSAYFNANTLNFIPIADWNLLDRHSQEEIWQLAKENPDLGIQFGIEKVDDNSEVITEIITQ
jgi:recombinational DNA repair ATPase RecF